jgi:hypothetical protein
MELPRILNAVLDLGEWSASCSSYCTLSVLSVGYEAGSAPRAGLDMEMREKSCQPQELNPIVNYYTDRGILAHLIYM